METAFIVVKTVAVIVAVVALIVWIVIEHRRKHPKMCDSCDQLYMIQRHSCSGKVLCPFCGGQAFFETVKLSGEPGYTVRFGV